jgi:hypothetical protein
MKLKHKITKEELAELSEALRALYAEQDGVFYLQVEGMVPKQRLDEFRDNNINLMEENNKLKKTVSAFGDLTPEALADLRKKAEAGGKGGTIDPESQEFKSALDAEVTKRTEKMRTDYEGEVNTLKTANSQKDERLAELIIDAGLSQAAAKKGVSETAMQDVILRGRQTFKVVDGKAVPYKKGEKGDEIIYGKDGATPLSMEDWLGERTADAPHWFKASTGSGSQHKQQPGGGATNVPEGVRGVGRMRAAREGQS